MYAYEQVLTCPSTDPALNTLNASPLYCFTSSLISSWKQADSPGSGLICDQSDLFITAPTTTPPQAPDSFSLGPLYWLLGGVQTVDQVTVVQQCWVSPFKHVARQTTSALSLLFELRRPLEVPRGAKFTMPSKGAASNKGRGVESHEIGLKL